MSFPPEFHRAKWAFLAIDADGKDYLAQAEVAEDAAEMYTPEKD